MRSNQTLKFFSTFLAQVPQLSEKEKKVLKKRLRKTPLKIIGTKFKLTGERIRQIEKQALDKVRRKDYQQSLF